jgi:hypothetical protein
VEANRVVRRRGFHILYNRYSDGGEVVSFTRRPPFTPGRFLVDLVVMRITALSLLHIMDRIYRPDLLLSIMRSMLRSNGAVVAAAL